MPLRFTKMHGLGNDFVVIDAIGQTVNLSAAQLRFLADRHFGVGCDQILIVEAPAGKEVDFRYRIFNADGGEVEQCGNGARCFARFVHDKGLTRKSEIHVETCCGVIVLRLEKDGLVTVDMGTPEFNPAEIPFSADNQAAVYELALDNGDTVSVSAVSMGNPHAVQLVVDIEQAAVAEQGALIERHPRFPARVNAGFMQIENEHAIRLRVFERGAGETLACGTGACAAVVAGIVRGLLVSPVTVQTRGGRLEIVWAGNGHSVMMTGSAVTVFEGEIELPVL